MLRLFAFGDHQLPKCVRVRNARYLAGSSASGFNVCRTYKAGRTRVFREISSLYYDRYDKPALFVRLGISTCATKVQFLGIDIYYGVISSYTYM